MNTLKLLSQEYISNFPVMKYPILLIINSIDFHNVLAILNIAPEYLIYILYTMKNNYHYITIRYLQVCTYSTVNNDYQNLLNDLNNYCINFYTYITHLILFKVVCISLPTILSTVSYALCEEKKRFINGH